MKKLAAVACHAAVILGALAPTAASSAERLEFEGFVHFCTSSPAEVFRVTPGGTVHIRRASNTNVWATNNALIDGSETNEVLSINVNRKGLGNAVIHATLEPFAFDGTWEITQVLTIEEEGISSHGVGHGTGELRGMTIKFNTDPEVIVSNSCSDLPSAPIDGVVISPRS